MWVIAGIVCLLVAIAFLIGGVDSYRTQRRERATWERGVGVVVALHEESTSDGSVFAPVIEFTTAQGGHGRFVGDEGSSPPTHAVGQSIPVLYDPATGHGRIDRGHDWALAGPQLAFGVLFGLIGAACIWQHLREP